jgi:DNA-binding protein H-NS
VATYLELKEQAEKLLAEAEKLREQEIADAIADIKRKMELYGLTAADLGLAKGVGPGSFRPMRPRRPSNTAVPTAKPGPAGAGASRNG